MTKRPESIGQAKAFDTRAGVYRAAGLCDACAAQAAFGHQLSFAQVRPPCPHCVSLIRLFPIEALNGWRALSLK